MLHPPSQRVRTCRTLHNAPRRCMGRHVLKEPTATVTSLGNRLMRLRLKGQSTRFQFTVLPSQTEKRSCPRLNSFANNSHFHYLEWEFHCLAICIKKQGTHLRRSEYQPRLHNQYLYICLLETSQDSHISKTTAVFTDWFLDQFLTLWLFSSFLSHCKTTSIRDLAYTCTENSASHLRPTGCTPNQSLCHVVFHHFWGHWL